MRRTHPNPFQCESGLTLIEVVVAIVLVGVALPTLAVHFSGMSGLKQPEYFTRATFLGTRQMEGIANEALANIPAAATYTCAGFAAARVGGGSFNIDCSSTEYVFAWQVDAVAANAPDTPSGGATFGKKITLTITRADGLMPDVRFFTLF